jgi:hypothetical protein
MICHHNAGMPILGALLPPKGEIVALSSAFIERRSSGNGPGVA